MAMILSIADAVVAELNGTSFSLPFMATRAYIPRFDLADMATLRVTVVPKGVEITRGSRGKDQHDYRVDIGVQQKFADEDADALDPLMGLVEQIADHFRGLVLETDPEAACVEVENGPVYAQEHMREGRLFTSILTLTFRAWR
jgi:hypothetical protein